VRRLLIVLAVVAVLLFRPRRSSAVTLARGGIADAPARRWVKTDYVRGRRFGSWSLKMACFRGLTPFFPPLTLRWESYVDSWCHDVVVV